MIVRNCRRLLHVTRHTSCVTRQTSHVTRHTTYVTRHTPQIRHYIPQSLMPTARQRSSSSTLQRIASHTSQVKNLKLFSLKVTLQTVHVKRQASHATRQISLVTRHTSHVTCSSKVRYQDAAGLFHKVKCVKHDA